MATPTTFAAPFYYFGNTTLMFSEPLQLGNVLSLLLLCFAKGREQLYVVVVVVILVVSHIVNLVGVARAFRLRADSLKK
jgi:hypothetical protein